MKSKRTAAAPKQAKAGAAPRGRSARHDRRVLEVLRKFRIVFKSAQQHSRRVESRCGVSAPQLWVLAELARNPGLRVVDLAQVMSLHLSTMSNLLDKLEKKGFLARSRDPADQRVVRVHLSDAGRGLLKAAPGTAMSLLPDTLFKLPDATLKKLDGAMSELVGHLEILDEEGALQPLNVADTRL